MPWIARQVSKTSFEPREVVLELAGVAHRVHEADGVVYLHVGELFESESAAADACSDKLEARKAALLAQSNRDSSEVQEALSRINSRYSELRARGR